MVLALLYPLSLVIPTEISDAFERFFSYVAIGNGIFPMNDALLAISFVLTVLILTYIVKIYLFGFSVIPWIGKYVVLPTQTTTSQSVSQVFDRKGRYQGQTESIRTSSSKRGYEVRNPFQKKRS